MRNISITDETKDILPVILGTKAAKFGVSSSMILSSIVLLVNVQCVTCGRKLVSGFKRRSRECRETKVKSVKSQDCGRRSGEVGSNWVGYFGTLKVLTAQPETRFATRFLFWQAVVVCAGAGRNVALIYKPPRKSVLRFFLVACVSLLEV